MLIFSPPSPEFRHAGEYAGEEVRIVEHLRNEQIPMFRVKFADGTWAVVHGGELLIRPEV